MKEKLDSDTGSECIVNTFDNLNTSNSKGLQKKPLQNKT